MVFLAETYEQLKGQEKKSNKWVYNKYLGFLEMTRFQLKFDPEQLKDDVTIY